MGLSGMLMHVRACGSCGVLALHCILAFDSRHPNRREPSKRYVAYTTQVRFGWLALLDALFASSM